MNAARKLRILIVDDKREYLESLRRVLERDFCVSAASSDREAKRLFSPGLDVVLLDIRLDDGDPSNRDGIELLKFMKKEDPTVPVIMMTAYGDVELAVESMKLGAIDFIQKTKTDTREIRAFIGSCLERLRLQTRVADLEGQLYRLEPWDIVGDDPKIEEIRRIIDAVASDGQTNVLIRGATGTGKELVARAIHSRGIRRKGAFVPVSLCALAANVIESELFGHEKGSFTGADTRRIGLVEKAHGGVLFLDEIGDLHLDLQAKLLRFLEDKTFRRIGSTETNRVDSQILLATNRNLETAVEDQDFREDLYFRIKTMQIVLPCLSERPGDIPVLAKHFVEIFKAQGRTRLGGISDSALRLLRDYSWPGNVRELRSCMERAVIYAEHNRHSIIELDDLPYEVRTGTPEVGAPLNLQMHRTGLNMGERLARLELAYVEKTLATLGGRKSGAWRVLGYNDRFALRRRICSIRRRFPALLDEFPNVSRSYFGGV